MRFGSYLRSFLSLPSGGGALSFEGLELESVTGLTAVQDELTLDALTGSTPKKNAVQTANHAHTHGMVFVIDTRLVVHNWTDGPIGWW